MFTTQMMPLFFSNDVKTEMCFPQNSDLNALASERSLKDRLQRAKPLLLLIIGGWQTNFKVHLPPPTGLVYWQKKKKKTNLYYLY